MYSLHTLTSFLYLNSMVRQRPPMNSLSASVLSMSSGNMPGARKPSRELHSSDAQ